MKEIPLTQGKVALVDDEDYKYLMQWKWCAHQTRPGTWRAERRAGRMIVVMHKELLPVVSPLEVDHKNGDSLDNQRHNLRPATESQNQANKKITKQNTSGYKGVDWRASEKKWRVRLSIGQKSIYLGRFTNVIEAAIAYDQAAQIHHGEFAWLNFSYDPACYI